MFKFDLRPGAQPSWRKTFLTDPPTRIAAIALLVSVDYRHGWLDFTVCDKDGLTLGAVIDAVFSTKAEAATLEGGRPFELEGGVTLSDLMAELSESVCDPASFAPMHTNIRLGGMVIPSEQEWREVSNEVVDLPCFCGMTKHEHRCMCCENSVWT